MNQLITQITSDDPTSDDPEAAIMPTGEIKIPEPIMLPTTIEIPDGQTTGELDTLTIFTSCVQLFA